MFLANERGVALPMVLAVLVCLLAVAIPFCLSMQGERKSVAVRVNTADARREAIAVADEVKAGLALTAPQVDETPYSDGEKEFHDTSWAISA